MRISKIETLYNKYFEDVCKVAHDEFERVIKPYLVKHELDFLAGNGTFWIGYNDPNASGGFISIDIDRLPRYIQDVLYMECPGLNNDLGSLMPDYKYNASDKSSLSNV